MNELINQGSHMDQSTEFTDLISRQSIEMPDLKDLHTACQDYLDQFGDWTT
jgi:hypothetical protein